MTILIDQNNFFKLVYKIKLKNKIRKETKKCILA